MSVFVAFEDIQHNGGNKTKNLGNTKKQKLKACKNFNTNPSEGMCLHWKSYLADATRALITVRMSACSQALTSHRHAYNRSGHHMIDAHSHRGRTVAIYIRAV